MMIVGADVFEQYVREDDQKLQKKKESFEKLLNDLTEDIMLFSRKDSLASTSSTLDSSNSVNWWAHIIVFYL